MILLLFVLFSTLAFTPIPTEKGYDIGDVVTDFKLENIDGKFVSLSSNSNNRWWSEYSRKLGGTRAQKQF